MEISKTRQFTFIVMMGALGNVLFLLTLQVLPGGQVILDLSHIGTMIAALYGGPLVGLATGSLVGIGPGIYLGFGGPWGTSFLGLTGLILGKAMTGLFVGYLAYLFHKHYGKRRSITSLMSVFLGYIPECLFTVLYFLVLIPFFFPTRSIEMLIVGSVVVKAWIEIILIGFYMGALAGNKGFSSFMERMIPKKHTK
jgi:riboflavin transporter FmnP